MILGGGNLEERVNGREDRIKNAERVGERIKQLLVDATSKDQVWLVRNLDMDRNVTYPGKDIIISIFDLATPAIDSHSILVKTPVNKSRE